MGTLTLTPAYIDYSAGSTWASLAANEAATKAVIQQVCDDFSAGLSPSSGNHSWKINFGVNAVGTSGADTTGQPVSGGASNNPTAGVMSYANYRTALLALSSPNSYQSIGWNSTNLPASDPTGLGSFTLTAALGSAINLTFTSVADGTVVACVGFAVASYGDLDQHGLGTGNNLYNGIAHELSESLGRWDNSAIWWYSSPGVHEVGATVARYLSADGSTANKIWDLDATGGGDSFDFATGQHTAFCFTLEAGAVSRNSTTPLRANDWLNMTLVGWGLTNTGLGWAGLLNPPTCSSNPVISGTATAGNSLTCSQGTWTNSPTLSDQWQKNGSNWGSPGTTSPTLANADRDAIITVVETGTNGAGSAQATSNILGPVLVTTKPRPFLR